MERVYCPKCAEFRAVLVGFRNEEWCIRCDTALNQEARHYDALRIPRPIIYRVIVSGQAETVIISFDQVDVARGRVRVLGVSDSRVMTVVRRHLHPVTS